MREIKFRAQRILGVNLPKEGWTWDIFTLSDLFESPSETLRIWYKVDTIGQFTGLIDRDGREVYEGDIIDAITNIDRSRFIVDDIANMWWRAYCANFWVIGNIYENPELVESARRGMSR
jgi:hypothetical protein